MVVVVVFVVFYKTLLLAVWLAVVFVVVFVVDVDVLVVGWVTGVDGVEVEVKSP